MSGGKKKFHLFIHSFIYLCRTRLFIDHNRQLFIIFIFLFCSSRFFFSFLFHLSIFIINVNANTSLYFDKTNRMAKNLWEREKKQTSKQAIWQTFTIYTRIFVSWFWTKFIYLEHSYLIYKMKWINGQTHAQTKNWKVFWWKKKIIPNTNNTTV